MQLNKIALALGIAVLTACPVEDDGETNASTSTDPSSTMTDPSTTMTDPVTTDPVTTDPVTTDVTTDVTSDVTTDVSTGTEDTSATDPSTTGADTSGGSETGTAGTCGWSVRDNFYACGFEGEDPKGAFPIECPAAFEEGAKCGPKSEITETGCCTPEGQNVYCVGTVVVEQC